jgi:hypothetical protein
MRASEIRAGELLTVPSPKQHRLSADCRRALQVLATSPDGCTEAIMLAHGFKLALLVGLISDGLATAQAERVMAGRRTVETPNRCLQTLFFLNRNRSTNSIFVINFAQKYTQRVSLC